MMKDGKYTLKYQPCKRIHYLNEMFILIYMEKLEKTGKLWYKYNWLKHFILAKLSYLRYFHSPICFSKRKLGTLKSDSTKIHSKAIKTLTVEKQNYLFFQAYKAVLFANYKLSNSF